MNVQSVRRFTLLVWLMFPLGLVAAPFSSLEEQMTREEFEASGLDRLTPQELARLNAWISRKVAGAAVPAAVEPEPAQDRRGLKRVDARPIVSRIAGAFTGWRGRTLFELENGQVWQQVGGGVFRVKLDSPEVIIEPAMFDSWRLKVKGYNASVKVRRIR